MIAQFACHELALLYVRILLSVKSQMEVSLN